MPKLSLGEIHLADDETTSYYANGSSFWLGTPWGFDKFYSVYYSAYIFLPYSSPRIGGVQDDDDGIARPSVSLKPGIEYVSGDGSFTNPFVVE